MGSFDENIMLRDFSRFMKKSLGSEEMMQKLDKGLGNLLDTLKEKPEKLHMANLGSLSYLVIFKK